MSRLPISMRLLLSFLLAATLPLVGLAWFYLSSFEQALKETVLENVSSIANKKFDQIDTFIGERLADAQTYGRQRRLQEALAASADAFRRGGLPATAATDRRYRSDLLTLLESAQYYDLLLIDADGNVVFSIKHEADLGSNLVTGPYRLTGLAQGFRTAMQTLDTDLTPFSEYAPSANKPAGFAVTPVVDAGGRLLGALALQINVEVLTEVVSDRTGLGLSGETVLAQRIGDEVLYTAPLLRMPDAAYRYRVPLKEAALPMQKAQAGENGRGIVRDYAGIEVAATWRYLPALHWGMVVKIDTAEAFAPAHAAQRLTWFALAALLLLSGAAAVFFGRSLSRPVSALTRAAASIAEGDLSQRAPVGGGPELATLAESFNRMVDRVAAAQTGLEAQVEERTAELRLYVNVFNHSGEAILISDSENRIVAINPALTQLTGFTIEDLRGRNPHMLSAGRTPPETYAAMWKALNDPGFWQGELWDRRKDGEPYPKWAAISAIRDDGGKTTHYIASFTDITERKANEERIYRLAHHDALTGLLNRFSLESRVEQALLSAKREGGQLAVMFIDLDRFKIINDTLGHHVGDQLLTEAAHRLQACVRESDIVARLGGDEFVVVLTGMEMGMAAAAAIAGKILHTLGSPYRIDGKELHSTPSVGISMYPADGEEADTLMKNADTAMYHAKSQGRNNSQFFTDAMNAATNERLELERGLRTALAMGQFELHYQPQVCTADSHICGVEALVRWRHPERGLVPPLTFIPIAEEAGLIEPLGAWVLDEACRQLAAWRTQGIEMRRMAVNLSTHQLRSPALVERVQATMAKHGIVAGELELEVTESVAMDNPERAIDQLKALRALGVELAIDDFGTGYSSLAYLKLLPIQTLKLDRAFVRDIESNENDAAISAATLALAHNLNLKVVAEGVETEGQRAFLAMHQCDYLQGYLFGRPELAAALEPKLPRSESASA